MKSFRELLRLRIPDYLMEMARKAGEDKGSKIDTFDENDINFFKYIIDRAPEKVISNNNLRNLVMRALFYRYGRPEEGGMLHKPDLLNHDLHNIEFNLGKSGRFTIENVPVYPGQVLDKIKARGWNPEHPHFGYGRANWQPLQQRSDAIIKYFEDGTPVPEKFHYYHPKDNAMLADAPTEVLQAHQARKDKGVQKSRDFGEFDEKSMEAVPLDADDEKYLKSVEEKFIQEYKSDDKEEYDKDLMPLFHGMEQKKKAHIPDVEKVKNRALMTRYSDRWIGQDPSTGSFYVKDLYKDKKDPEGLMYGSVDVVYREGRPPVHLTGVYLNLPALAQKFDRYKKTKNFVKEPIDSQNAERWIQRKKQAFNHATKFGSMLQDNAFLDAITKDQDAWVKSDGRGAVGSPVPPELEKKLTWRSGGKIVESPNIADSKLRRNTDTMSWQEIIQDDAQRAAMQTIKHLAGTAYAKWPGFVDWAKNPVEFQEMISRAINDLNIRKTGEDPQMYRSESQRLKWANAAVERTIGELLKARGKGEAGKDADEMPSEIESAPSKEGGLTTNTGKSHHRGEEDIPQDFVAAKDQAIPEPEVQTPRGLNPQDWEAEVSRMQQSQQKALAKPKGIPLSQWMQMSREQKLAAMQRYKV